MARIFAFYDDELKHYIIKLIRKGNKADNLKFDTGAICTVIGLDTLKSVKSNIDEVKNYSQWGEIKEFTGAGGSTFNGYLTCMENVKMGKRLIKKFYFYLCPDADVSLLGVDFLRYCSYSHEKESNIIIDDFDEDKYIKQFEGKTYSVLSSDDEDEKGITAYRR